MPLFGSPVDGDIYPDNPEECDVVNPPGFEFPGPAERSAWVVRQRPDRNVQRRALRMDRAAGWIEEREPDGSGVHRRVVTVFLTNRECPWRCLMCDLWQHTTLETVPAGAIAAQIGGVLEVAPAPEVIKLYNAGSFFDPGAIPPSDHESIANLVRSIPRVVVECHPLLVGPRVRTFSQRLRGSRLEVALGLESVHAEVLERLNKGMTVEDFVRAAGILRAMEVEVRAFVLVKPPFLGDGEALEWAVRSARVAFESGAGVVSLIPTRMGNGSLEVLARHGHFAEPSLDLLEDVVDRVVGLGGGRVFVDLWDLARFGAGAPQFAARRARLEAMNLSQQILPRITLPA
ncbi:MAG: hypothetical protein RIS76_4447 [Verrucomicrobiota bacterium]